MYMTMSVAYVYTMSNHICLWPHLLAKQSTAVAVDPALLGRQSTGGNVTGIME